MLASNDYYALGNITLREAVVISMDSKSVIEKFQRTGVLYQSMACIKCTRAMYIGKYKNLDGYIWRCLQCKTKTSIRKDSYFERHKIEIGKLFLMIICFLKYDKIPAVYLSELCEISEESLVMWGCHVRESISH